MIFLQETQYTSGKWTMIFARYAAHVRKWTMIFSQETQCTSENELWFFARNAGHVREMNYGFLQEISTFLLKFVYESLGTSWAQQNSYPSRQPGTKTVWDENIWPKIRQVRYFNNQLTIERREKQKKEENIFLTQNWCHGQLCTGICP